MTTLPDLHDGFFDGLWLSADKHARIFVRTAAGIRSTIILTDVEALNICGLKVGNIILDLVLIAPNKLTVKDRTGLRLEKWRRPERKSTSPQRGGAGPLWA
jgi:hypothetical protein